MCFVTREKERDREREWVRHAVWFPSLLSPILKIVLLRVCVFVGSCILMCAVCVRVFVCVCMCVCVFVCASVVLGVGRYIDFKHWFNILKNSNSFYGDRPHCISLTACWYAISPALMRHRRKSHLKYQLVELGENWLHLPHQHYIFWMVKHFK